MLTVDEVRALQAALEAKITELLQEFQTASGCNIHSVPITEGEGPRVKARVKVQL